MHKIVSVAVVAVWAGMLFALAAKTHTPPLTEAPAAAQGGTRENWMGIYLDGAKAGYAHHVMERTPGGYRVSEDVHAALNVMESRQDMAVSTVSELDETMSLIRFEFGLKSGSASMSMTGTVSGNTLHAVVDSAGRKGAYDISLKGPIRLASDLEHVLEREGVEVGRTLRMPFFDPASLSEQYMDVHVEAREEMKLGGEILPVYRIREEYAGVAVTSWYSPGLGTVKSEGLMGFTFLMETKEQAMKKPAGGYQPADVIALASIQAEGNVPVPGGSTYMKAELTGAGLDGLDLSGGRQTLDGRVVTVRMEAPDSAAGYTLPFAGGGMERWLSPTPFIQSGDPEISGKAEEITGDERDARKAARLLSDWVYVNVSKRPTAGIPSAVEVLGSMQGDCNEHTVLFTALARSAGIPARMDAGLVMLGGRFYYHAWPEVYLGQWVSIDPTLGQFPADATHIRLVEGGPEKQTAILKLIGKLKVRILEHG